MARQKSDPSSEKESASSRDTGTADEVARRAGVSVMTVSRALRGMPNVSPTTRERILAIARELDYQPSLAARSLRTGKVDVVGFATWSHDSLRGAYHSETLAGMDSILAREGYSVLLAVPRTPEELVENAQRLVREGRVGALVFQASRMKPADVAAIRDLKVPSVLINYHRPTASAGRGISFMAYDNDGGIEQAVRHLVALGHRRIAYIGGTPDDLDAIEREKGFVKAAKAVGVTCPPEWIRPGDFGRAVESGRTQCDFLLSEGKRGPTAIVCASDEIAAGVLVGARAAGKEVPRDLSVVGFDNEAASALFVPPLTTLNHSGWDIGIAAGEEILRRLRDPKARPTTAEMPVSLVVRESTCGPA